MNFQTFSQVAFAFRVTPELLTMGLFYALAMGLIGGLLPAIRAARLPISTALRELRTARRTRECRAQALACADKLFVTSRTLKHARYRWHRHARL